MTFVQKVKYLLFVHLEVAAVNSEMFSSQVALLFNQIKKQSDRTGHDPFVWSSLNLCLRCSRLILLILITLHSVRFPTACLAIRKNSWVKSLSKPQVKTLFSFRMTYIYNLSQHAWQTSLVEYLVLARIFIEDKVKLRILELIDSLVVSTSLKLKGYLWSMLTKQLCVSGRLAAWWRCERWLRLEAGVSLARLLWCY
jgi:hypothetical protein